MIELLLNMTDEGSEGHIGWFENRQLRLIEIIETLMPVNIIEIGFNMGHSCKLICDTISGLKDNNEDYDKKEVAIYVFDICTPFWMESNVDALRQHYKDRNIKLSFIKGSTLDTLKPFLGSHDGSFDFIEVDGSHVFEIAHSDILNVYDKVREGGVLYVDDYTPSDIDSPVVKAVASVNWDKYDTWYDDDIFFGVKKYYK